MGSHILYGAVRPTINTSDEDWYGVAAQVGTRVYDYVSTAPAYPFLRCTPVIASPWEATGGVRGSLVRLQADSICVHGDSPGALAMTTQVRHVLEGAGVTLAPFA